jgi:predicted transcriptional regulator
MVTEAVRDAGKFEPGSFALELEAAEATLSREVLRWMVGKELHITTKGDVYNRKWDADTYEKALDHTLEREYYKNLILQTIKTGCSSPRAISEKIGLDLKMISYLLADMEKMSMVEFTGMKDSIPAFGAL